MKIKLFLLTTASLFATAAKAEFSNKVVLSDTAKSTICKVLVSDVRDYASSPEELKQLVSECVASGNFGITFDGTLSGKGGTSENCSLKVNKDGKISSADCQD